MKNAFYFMKNTSKLNRNKYLGVFLVSFLCFIIFGGTSMAFFNELIPSSKINESFTDKNTVFIGQMIPFAIGIIFVLLFLRLILKIKVLELLTNRNQFSYKRFFLSAFIWLVISAAFLGAFVFFGIIKVEWNFHPSAFFFIFFLSLFFTPIQTLFEEFLFRGLLLKFFGNLFKKGWLTIISSGFCFGLVHFTNPEIQELGIIAAFFYVFSGCFISFIAVMDDGLELAWGFHFANNFFAFVFLTNDWQAVQTDALFNSTSKDFLTSTLLIEALILYPLFLLIITKIFKWTEFKKRLFTLQREEKELKEVDF